MKKNLHSLKISKAKDLGTYLSYSINKVNFVMEIINEFNLQNSPILEVLINYLMSAFSLDSFCGHPSDMVYLWKKNNH